MKPGTLVTADPAFAIALGIPETDRGVVVEVSDSPQSRKSGIDHRVLWLRAGLERWASADWLVEVAHAEEG